MSRSSRRRLERHKAKPLRSPSTTGIERKLGAAKVILSRFSLEDRVVIVTGAGRNIGKSIALGLAEAGAHVVAADMNFADAEATRAEIQAKGRRALAVHADVRDAEQVADMVRRTLDEFQRIDILVNNAGGGFMCKVVDMSQRAWEAVIRENLTTVFLCSKAVAEPMMSQKNGSIINVSSVTGHLGCPGSAPYAAAKAAIINLTRTLALEWAGFGIRVNAIAPGPIETEQWCAIASSVPGYYEDMVKSIPMGRLGRVDDIPPAVIYLASDASLWVTGHTLNIDGGQMYMPMIQ